MNRRLIDIKEISSIQQTTGGDISSFLVIDYQGNHLGEGGVGSVHPVISIDGTTTNGLVIKIISAEAVIQEAAYQSIRLLHEKIRLDTSLNGLSLYFEYPELSGLPFMVFKAIDALDSTEVTGMLMYDLSTQGYEDMGSEEWQAIAYLKASNWEHRLFMAYQYARAVAYLHKNTFIHCDLKEKSVFINKEKASLTLIDFDGGYNYDKQSKALTIGAPGTWISRVIKKAMAFGKSSSDFSPKERLQEEYYIVAAGIFNIIFGFPPYFFLRDGEEETIITYLKKDKWPYCDNAAGLVKESNLPAQQWCVQQMEQLQAEGYGQLITNLSQTFNKGYKNEKSRISASDWELLLKEIAQQKIGAAQIESFTSDKQVIKSKQDPVQLFWAGRYYKYAKLGSNHLGIGEQSTILYLGGDSKIEIQFKGYFGNAAQALEIKAEKIDPVIHQFQSSVVKRTTLDPVVLKWKVAHTERVCISSHLEDLPAEGFLEVDPRSNTTYTLTAFGNFDQEVTAQVEVDVLQPTITEFKYEINIEPGIDNVDLYWGTEDATEVRIDPRPGKVALDGFAQIGIPDRTVFTLTAEGHFGTTTKSIEAKPFPLPLIKSLLVPTPDFKLSTQIPFKELEVPKQALQMPSFSLDSSINFNPTPGFTDLNIQLKGILDSIPQPPVTEDLLRDIFNQNKQQ